MTTFTVASIDSRIANTRNGPKPTYSLIDTDGNTYKFGFTNPNTKGISVGVVVTGTVTPTRWGNEIDPKSLSIGGTPPAASGGTKMPPVATASYQSKGSSQRPFPIPVDHGDMAIVRQNSLTNAVSTVADYVATRPSEEWPTLEKWTEMVIDTAYKYAKFSSGQREAEVVDKIRKVGMETSALTAALTNATSQDDDLSEDEAA